MTERFETRQRRRREGVREAKGEQQNWNPTTAIAEVWLIERRSHAQGHAYVNCSFVAAAGAAVHHSLRVVLSDHRDTSSSQIKQPQSHMQEDQQLPRAPPVPKYSMFFFSPACCNRAPGCLEEIWLLGAQ